MLLNCGVGEDPWTAKRSNQSILKEISLEYSLEGLMLKLKLQYLATSCEEMTHWKRPWCWERLKAGGEGDDRGWDGWMASPTQWTWVWVGSGSWWWTGRPGVLQSTGLQRVGHDWATELNWNTRCMALLSDLLGTQLGGEKAELLPPRHGCCPYCWPSALSQHHSELTGPPFLAIQPLAMHPRPPTLPQWRVLSWWYPAVISEIPLVQSPKYIYMHELFLVPAFLSRSTGLWCLSGG